VIDVGREVQADWSNLNQWRLICYSAATLGLIVAAFGFWNWAKHQSVNDRLLSNQLKAAELQAVQVK
jgi:hypothetical protein